VTAEAAEANRWEAERRTLLSQITELRNQVTQLVDREGAGVSPKDRMNDLVAAGALIVVLWSAIGRTGLTGADVVRDENGMATNAIEVRFSILNSPYRVTVERVRSGGHPS
jgi:hypothetical protein